MALADVRAIFLYAFFSDRCYSIFSWNIQFETLDGVYPHIECRNNRLLDDVDVNRGTNKNTFRFKPHLKWSQENLENEISKGTEIRVKPTEFSSRYLKAENRKKNGTKQTNQW